MGQEAGGSEGPTPMSKREEFEKLLRAVHDSAFDCGEHAEDVHTEPFHVVYLRSIKAKEELRDFLEPYLQKD